MERVTIHWHSIYFLSVLKHPESDGFKVDKIPTVTEWYFEIFPDIKYNSEKWSMKILHSLIRIY